MLTRVVRDGIIEGQALAVANLREFVVALLESPSILLGAVEVHAKVDHWLRQDVVEIQLTKKEHQVREEYDADRLDCLRPCGLRPDSDERLTLNYDHADVLVAKLPQDFVQRVLRIRSHHVLVTLRVADCSKFMKVVLEEVDITFVVLYQEFQHVLGRDYSLQLTALVCCQRDRVQIVFIQRLDRAENFLVDVEVNKLTLVVEAFLRLRNLQPVHQRHMLHHLHYELEATHLETASRVVGLLTEDVGGAHLLVR